MGAGRYGPLSLGEVFAGALDDPWQPPLYYLLLWGWGRLVGWSDVALRALSLLVGVLVVPLMARLGAVTGGRRVGVLSGGLAAGSAFIVYYFHELRPYSLFLTASAAFLLCYWTLAHAKRQTARNVSLYVASVALLAYSHYFSALLMLGVGVYHLLFMRGTRRFWWVGLWTAAGVALFLPWLSVPIAAFGDNVTTGQRTNMANTTLLGMLPYALSNGVTWLLLPVLVGAVWAARRWWRVMAFALLAGGVLLGLAVTLNVWLPLVAHSRYVAPLWVAFILLAAVSVARLPCSAVVVPAFLVLWVGVGAWQGVNTTYFDRLFTQRGIDFFSPHLRWDAVAEVIDVRGNPNEALIFSTGVHPWAVAGAYNYYLADSGVRHVLASQLPGETLTDEVEFFIGDAPRVWVGTELGTPADETHAQIIALLEQDYVRCETAYDDGQLQMTLYARETVCCTPPAENQAQMGTGVALGVSATDAQQQMLEVTLGWQVDEGVPPETYSVTTYLLDTANELAAQADYPLPQSDFMCATSRLPTDDLAPGDYTLYTAVYDWRTGERLSEAFPLETVTVE